jgi:DNA (cytosine-5)-methyltransferase 1
LKQKFTVFSLFSGAGGLDLGFVLTNAFDILFANDIKFQPTHTYASNFEAKHITAQPRVSDVPAVFFGDVASVQFEELEDLAPDVIIGGPPCQDFSIVRGPQAERSGISVTRGKLYSHYIRALIHLQPRFFVFENVPGLMSANQGTAYNVIRDDFLALNLRWNEIKSLVANHSEAKPQNYDIVFSDLIDASRLGAPQKRTRLVIIGLRKDLTLSGTTKEEIKRKIASQLKGEHRLVSKYPLTTIEAFEGKPLPALESQYADSMKEYDGVFEEVKTEKAYRWKRDTWDRLTYNAVKDYLTLNRIKPDSKEEANKAFEEHAELLKELGFYNARVAELKCIDDSNRIPKDSEGVLERLKRIPPDENHEFVRNTEWEVEGRGMGLIYRRSHPLKPSYTVVAHGGGGTWGYHYERKRATLTNRENARLQTFPDTFCFRGNRSEVRAQIGEAVPPLMSKRIAEAIADILVSID